MSRKVRFMLALVVLTLFLGSGAAHALPPQGRNADPGPGMLVAAWDWLASLVEGNVPFLRSVEALETILPPPDNGGDSSVDHGVFIDPNG